MFSEVNKILMCVHRLECICTRNSAQSAYIIDGWTLGFSSVISMSRLEFVGKTGFGFPCVHKDTRNQTCLIALSKIDR
jgi:hypothetical protein